jgi:hypothetical protein
MSRRSRSEPTSAAGADAVDEGFESVLDTEGDRIQHRRAHRAERYKRVEFSAGLSQRFRDEPTADREDQQGNSQEENRPGSKGGARAG